MDTHRKTASKYRRLSAHTYTPKKLQISHTKQLTHNTQNSCTKRKKNIHKPFTKNLNNKTKFFKTFRTKSQFCIIFSFHPLQFFSFSFQFLFFTLLFSLRFLFYHLQYFYFFLFFFFQILFPYLISSSFLFPSFHIAFLHFTIIIMRCLPSRLIFLSSFLQNQSVHNPPFNHSFVNLSFTHPVVNLSFTHPVVNLSFTHTVVNLSFTHPVVNLSFTHPFTNPKLFYFISFFSHEPFSFFCFFFLSILANYSMSILKSPPPSSFLINHSFAVSPSIQLLLCFFIFHSSVDSTLFTLIHLSIFFFFNLFILIQYDTIQ